MSELDKYRFSSNMSVGDADQCWEWQKKLTDNGYGIFCFNNERHRAHRASWFAFRGEIPTGQRVLHRCDNRKFVNPNHLWLGTHAENLADMTRKERGCRTTLTAEQVLEMRELWQAGKSTQWGLARKYGVKQTAIWLAIHRKTWTHI